MNSLHTSAALFSMYFWGKMMSVDPCHSFQLSSEFCCVGINSAQLWPQAVVAQCPLPGDKWQGPEEKPGRLRLEFWGKFLHEMDIKGSEVLPCTPKPTFPKCKPQQWESPRALELHCPTPWTANPPHPKIPMEAVLNLWKEESGLLHCCVQGNWIFGITVQKCIHNS